MARFRKTNESMYDQLAEAYEAASIVGVSRHYNKYLKNFDKRNLENNPIIPESSKRVVRYHQAPITDSRSNQASDETKKYVTDTAEGLKYHLKLGMDNLSAKMAASATDSMVSPAEGFSYFTDKYVARDFFESSTPLRKMMRPK